MHLQRDVLARTAWLFTRDQDSIYIQLERPGDGWRLVLHGPGEAWKAYDFSDTEALITFHESFERDLVAAGFHLQAVAERRSGDDRRSSPRTAARDRRR
jgi:hypothetical protein